MVFYKNDILFAWVAVGSENHCTNRPVPSLMGLFKIAAHHIAQGYPVPHSTWLIYYIVVFLKSANIEIATCKTIELFL